MLVVRPSDPTVALRLAQEAIAQKDLEKLARLPTHVEAAGVAYTFAGYLAKRPGGTRCVVDADCRVLGELVPGDSFVTTATPPPAYGAQIALSTASKPADVAP